ncbi:hypothetical protein DFH09DRAFT_1120647 [Mycena vulgaris]|nr:hypothetical protein DFH09DRAFT_1120647 [Mycena vulgaris]
MSTMLDTQLDAHMADYPIDIEMHQPAEPWFDPEARMEDDATLESHWTDHDSTLSVEVNMEDLYGENEYEMGDGEGEENYEEMSSDLTPPSIPADHASHSDSHPFDIDSPATAKPSMLSLAPTPAMSPLPPFDAELPDALASEPVEIKTSSAEHPTDPPAELAAPLLADETAETTQEHHHESAEVQERVEPSNSEEPPLEPHPAETHQSSDAADPDSRAVEEAVVADPHEISEGVYIDPPPAVLPARSRSPSPSTEGHGQGLPSLHRLASVFEALRQEEYLTRIPQFADSELVLDAYDLQLVISEDNVYAREVTLHDLNALHDGSDITGPLRLRLRAVVPRFILRYHLLQDQVARLNLTATGDEQEQSADSSDPQQQGSNDNSTDPPNLDSNPTSVQEDQREGLKEEREREPEATSADADTRLQHPESVQEEYPDADEYVESHGEGKGDDGEKLQHGEGDAEAEGLPELPDDDDDEEEAAAEEFVVVETPGPKPIIALTGPAADDTGKEIEQAPDPQPPLSPGHHTEPGILEDESDTNVNTEDPTGTEADNSVDLSAHDDATYQGDSYADEDAQWEDAVEDGDPDTTWEAEVEHETTSNESSVTLSSKASKRSFDEVELEEDEADGSSPPGSPGAKRTRVD